MLRITTLITLTLVVACGDPDPSVGSITSTVYGEAFIEDGIPADAFTDGWAIEFDAFLVSIGNPKAQAGERGPEVGDDGFYLVDLAQPSGGAGYELATYDAPAGTYDHYGYQLWPDADAHAVNASPADAAAMKAAATSVWVRGTATRASETRTFDWAFALQLTYAHCEMNAVIGEDTDANSDANSVEMQATIHADHLFYDDAVSPEPGLAFQLIADADGADGTTPDGAISLAELAATDIRAQTRYQVGSLRDPAGAAIENLGQYVAHQVTTLGHINGEGHCADVIVTP